MSAYQRNKTFVAEIRVENERIYLGTYPTLDLAKQVYKSAKCLLDQGLISPASLLPKSFSKQTLAAQARHYNIPYHKIYRVARKRRISPQTALEQLITETSHE